MKENPAILCQTHINKHEQVGFTPRLQSRLYVKKKKKSINISQNINKLVKSCWKVSIGAKKKKKEYLTNPTSTGDKSLSILQVEGKFLNLRSGIERGREQGMTSYLMVKDQMFTYLDHNWDKDI